MPDIPFSRPSEKIDHTKCGLPVVEEPPTEAVTRLLEEFPDVFAELPKGLPKSRPTDHPFVVDETQTPPAHRLYRMPAANQKANGRTRGSRENQTLDEPFWSECYAQRQEG